MKQPPGRNPDRLQHAAREIDSEHRGLSTRPIPPHVMGHGRAHYGRLPEMDFAHVRRALDEHLLLVTEVARNGVEKVRPGGTLLFMSGTGGFGIASTVTAALPAIANVALELA